MAGSVYLSRLRAGISLRRTPRFREAAQQPSWPSLPPVELIQGGVPTMSSIGITRLSGTGAGL